MKPKLIIFIMLNVSGFILATLGVISSPSFHNANYFWPAGVIVIVGPILFGWIGILAVITFSFLADLVTDPTCTLPFIYIIPSFVQGYLAFYLFRRFNCDINLKGWRSILLFCLAATIIHLFWGGILASSALLCIGKIASMSDFLKMIFLWFIDSVPCTIIFGIPIIKIFAPILKEYHCLFGQAQINTSCSSGHINKNACTHFNHLPIFLKILFSLLIVGVIPISILGAYEVVISEPNTTVINVNAFFVCFSFFGTLILTGVLTRIIISPIKKLAYGIKKITEGDFDYRVETLSDDELGKLADAFNKMTKTVKENIQQKEIYMQKVSENEKLAVIGRTTSIVAHDIRKPFAMLKTMLRLLPNLAPKQTKDYSEDLDISIRKVDAMLKDIMETSREMEYDLIPRNILSILDLAIKDVSRYHPNKHVDFYYNFDIVALIDLDESRMCRAFENIIDNAFDCLPDKKGFMWFSIKEKNNKAKIVIGNSHSHILENQINKIFQNTFTFGKKEGTGLGLSIVTKVINGHKGSVFARNVQAAPFFVPEKFRNIQGVEFEVILPLSEKPGFNLKDPLLKNSGEAKAALGMVKKESSLAGSSEIDTLIEKLESLTQKPNLLILDDESIYRMRVRDVLGNLGDLSKLIHVYDASSYKEATDVLSHTKIDYLICDIDLSNKINDGFSVLSKTLEKYPNSMVLIHTNRKKPKDINKAKALGACGYCTKPITEAILVDLLLSKELWPSDFRKKQSEQSRKHTTKYVKTVPHSAILIVNDDPLALKLALTMIEAHIDPKDNISIFTGKSYVEARDIIDNKKLDVLISDFNLDSPETGVDVCQYMEEQQFGSVRIIYSGMAGKEIEGLKEANKNCIDDVFSNSYELKDILTKAFKTLRKKSKNYGREIK